MFLHSLARTEVDGKLGWCAPVELGELAPHYISFAIPVDKRQGLFDEYTCETVTADAGEKRIDSYELLRQGGDAFLLRIGEVELWFAVRAVPRGQIHLPYLGKLEHADFSLFFTEIEPEAPEKLDRLFDEQGTYVIGCEPFVHYLGIKELAKSH